MLAEITAKQVEENKRAGAVASREESAVNDSNESIREKIKSATSIKLPSPQKSYSPLKSYIRDEMREALTLLGRIGDDLEDDNNGKEVS